MIAVTRCYRFPAAHVLAHPSLSRDENERIYGKCANPEGHGHTYGLEVTVAGDVRESTGRVIEPGLLDAIVRERVLERLAYRRMNDDPWFASAVPTAENICRAIHAELAPPIAAAGTARLVQVRLIETRRNQFEYGEMR